MVREVTMEIGIKDRNTKPMTSKLNPSIEMNIQNIIVAKSDDLK
jgi:hypothetical protein